MPANYAHVVPGPAEILVGTGSQNALENLGYTDRGVEIRFTAYSLDVPCDDHGGEHGPPSDIQYFGERATVRLTLTKFDTAITAKLDPLLKGGTAGTPGTVGELVFAGTKHFRLVVKSTTDPYNFPCAVLVKEPREIPVHGSRYQARTYVFECYKDPVVANTSTYGKLYNAVTS